MRIVILTVGSRGDVEPFIALGAGLTRAGHAVRLATHELFRDAVTGAGLAFASLPGDPRALRAEVEPELARTGSRQFRVISRIRRAVAAGVGDLVRDAETACRDAEVILYRDVLFAVGYSLAEATGSRPVAATLVPRTPTRAFAFPRPLPFGGAGNLLSYRLTEQLFWQLLRPSVNRWRTTELGLPPYSLAGPVPDSRRRRTPILCGFSEALVPRPPDWPPENHITGFWAMSPPEGWQPPPALVDFLTAGSPPIFVGFGSSTGSDAEALTALVVEALARVGRRGVLAMGWGGLSPSAAARSDRIFVVESVPHAWLLPRVAAVVHHGGAGTTAAGLRAGRPSVVIPSFGDQFFWADRVSALGAGPAPIPRTRLTAARLAEAIRSATTEGSIGLRAEILGRRLQAEDGVAAAVAALTHHLEADAWRWDR
jgi:UDP:flavonoid glycosyltransferase YjiC (YdhE family)